MSIKPIETTYAGHRFRSRLEARWAVFFDAYGVEWIYEPQGYETDAGRYLPDFWLPDISAWVDVKGTMTPDVWRRLCGVLWALPAKPEDLPARRKRGTPVLLLLSDIPSAEDAQQAMHVGLRWGIAPDRTPRTWWQFYHFANPKWLFTVGDAAIADPDLYASEPDLGWLIRAASNAYISPNPLLAQAYDRARRARFEYGESG